MNHPKLELSENTSSIPTDETVDHVQRRRVLVASVAGTVIEWYDFTLYGLAAALVFAPLFFPGAGELGGLLAAFGTYAAGFLVRPVGGLIFAHFGDRIGRKPMLLATLLVMGVATTLIGVLPTAAQIGWWAPVLLVTLRIAQAAGAGAEYSGAVTMVAESSGTSNRALNSSYPGAAIYGGICAATIIFALITTLPEDAFLSWGWRVPFLASGVIVAVAAFLRYRVKETSDFTESKAGEQVGETVRRTPFVESFKSHRKVILCAFCLFSFVIPWSYSVMVFMLSYVTKNLGLEYSHALMALLFAEIMTIPLVIGFGALADRIGRKPVLLFGAVVAVLFAFPMFWLAETRSIWMVALSMLIGLSVVQGATLGASAALLSEVFETRVRWTGITISREIPAAIVAGTAPLVATALFAWAGSDPWPVALYLLILAIIGLMGIMLLPETLGRRTNNPELKNESTLTM